MQYPSSLMSDKLAASQNFLGMVFLFLCCNVSLFSGGFCRGTLIRTHNGRCVPIEQLDLQNPKQNKVLSANLESKVPTHFFCWQKVNSIDNRSVKKHVEITVNGETLKVDCDQKFLSLDRKNWVKALDLRVGEKLCSFYGIATIENKFVDGHIRNNQSSAYECVVYYLNVDSTHTFFIGMQSLLVHNITVWLTPFMITFGDTFASISLSFALPEVYITFLLTLCLAHAFKDWTMNSGGNIDSNAVAKNLFHNHNPRTTYIAPLTNIAENLPSPFYAEFAPGREHPSRPFPANDPFARNHYDFEYGVSKVGRNDSLGVIVYQCYQERGNAHWLSQKDDAGNTWEYNPKNNSFSVKDMFGYFLMDITPIDDGLNYLVHFARNAKCRTYTVKQPTFASDREAITCPYERTTDLKEENRRYQNDLLFSVILNECKIPDAPMQEPAVMSQKEPLPTEPVQKPEEKSQDPIVQYEDIADIFWESEISDDGDFNIRVVAETTDGELIYSDWGSIDENGNVLEKKKKATTNKKNKKNKSENQPPKDPKDPKDPDKIVVPASILLLNKKVKKFCKYTGKILDKGIRRYNNCKKTGEKMVGKHRVDFFTKENALICTFGACALFTCNKLAEWTGLKNPDPTVQECIKDMNEKHKNYMDQTRNQHKQDIDEIHNQHKQDIDEIHNQHKQDIDEIHNQHKQDIDTIHNQHKQDIDEIHNQHKQDIDELKTQKQELGEELGQVKTQNQEISEKLDRATDKMQALHDLFESMFRGQKP